MGSKVIRISEEVYSWLVEFHKVPSKALLILRDRLEAREEEIMAKQLPRLEKIENRLKKLEQFIENHTNKY